MRHHFQLPKNSENKKKFFLTGILPYENKRTNSKFADSHRVLKIDLFNGTSLETVVSFDFVIPI